MLRKSISRLAFTVLLAFVVGAQLSAQTPAVPTITFKPQSGVTVHKALVPSVLDVLPVRATFSDPTGLIYAVLSAQGGGASSYYPTHPTLTSLTTYFYYDYCSTGDYTFTATAYNTLYHSVTQKITVHVVSP